MPVHFATSPEFDLDSIRLSGISAKENEDPIGYFGTGLKYAIAIILRAGLGITLRTGSDTHTLSLGTKVFRGKIFSQVYLDDEPLAFTTELGKNWELWQAYRELHSNTLDEGGTITNRPIEANTVITVTGSAFEEIYHQRDQIFLASEPLYANDRLEVHPNPSEYLYYRGIRVHKFKDPSLLTYNLIQGVTLTEDRTIKSIWDANYELGKHLPSFSPDLLQQTCLTSGSAEQSFPFTYASNPSKEVLNWIGENYTNRALAPGLKRLYKTCRPAATVYEPKDPTPSQVRLLASAFRVLPELNCDLTPSEVTLTDSLPSETFGVFIPESSRIYISTSTFDWGLETLLATLYEEWLHKKHKLLDESRAMQNFLFQRLASMAVEASRSPGLPFSESEERDAKFT